MKKLVILLWILILVGFGFIGYHYFKKDPVTDKTTTPETVIDSQNTAPVSTQENIPLPSAEKLAETSLPDLLKLTDAYLANQELEKAKTTLAAAAEIADDQNIIALYQARLNLAARDIEGAKALIWALPEEAQNMPEVKYYRAVILVLYKEFPDAQSTFKTLVEDPNTSQLLKDRSQKFLAAFETFSYYTEADNAFLELLLSKALADVGEYNSAIPLLFEIIQTQNNYRDAWVVLGYCYLNTRQYQDAIDALTQAKDLDPEKPETLFFLGLSYFAKGNTEQALAYLEKADERGFSDEETLNTKLGDLYLAEEDYEQASAKYETVLDASENANLELIVKIVWINIEKTNDTEKALTFATLALEKYPEEAVSHNLVGWAYTANGDYEEAKKHLEQAIEINPEFDAAHLNIAWLYQKQGFTNLAREYYKKAYILGQGTAIGNLAAERYNSLTESETKSFSELNVTPKP